MVIKYFLHLSIVLKFKLFDIFVIKSYQVKEVSQPDGVRSPRRDASICNWISTGGGWWLIDDNKQWCDGWGRWWPTWWITGRWWLMEMSSTNDCSRHPPASCVLPLPRGNGPLRVGICYLHLDCVALTVNFIAVHFGVPDWEVSEWKKSMMSGQGSGSKEESDG